MGFVCGVETTGTAACEDWYLAPDGPFPERYVPYTVREVKIWGPSHNDLSDPNNCQLVNVGPNGGSCPYAPAQVSNELRRTVGHELGHTVGMCHHGQCEPLDDTGVPISLMTLGFVEGPPETDSRSQSNAFDIQQIRLHQR